MPNPLYTWILAICMIYGLTTMPNPLNTYIRYIWFGLFEFYGISTIVGYFKPNPLQTYLSNIYDLEWLGSMACQLL